MGIGSEGSVLSLISLYLWCPKFTQLFSDVDFDLKSFPFYNLAGIVEAATTA